MSVHVKMPVNPNNSVNYLPVVLLLDTSSSMTARVSASVTRIDALASAFNQYQRYVFLDEIARYSVDTCVVTFGGTVEIACGFRTGEQFETIELRPTGHTPLGEAFLLGCDLLEERKQEYKNNRVSYYQPIIIILSDGEANDIERSLWERAVQRCTTMVRERKLTVIPIAVGGNEAVKHLSQLSPAISPIIISKELDFSRLFSLISQNVVAISNNADPDAVIQRLKEGMKRKYSEFEQ
jgi:uncharacterized protein YegL